MSRDGSCQLTWGGDLRTFRLDIKGLLALQEACAAGPMEILNRIRLDTWRLTDLRNILRIGLIGGGMDGVQANLLVDQEIVPGKILRHKFEAFTVLLSALQGGEDDDPVGKEGAADQAPETSVSQPPASTVTEP